MNSNEQAFEANLEFALGLYRAGDYVKSLEAYEIACQQPSHRGHHGRGDCLLAMNEPKAAVAAFRAALRLAPRYFRSHLNIATALLHLGRVDEAVFHARQADRFKPGDPNIHAMLAKLPEAPIWQDVSVDPGSVPDIRHATGDARARQVLLVYPAARVTDSSQTTNVYQAWGLLLRRAFEAQGWQTVACTPAALVSGDANQFAGGKFQFAVLLDYSGSHIGSLVTALRQLARTVAYFNESASPQYTAGVPDNGCPDFYYQASLCGPAEFDYQTQWASSHRLRIVPAFRTLAAAAHSGATAVLVNGPFPPRYALRFEEEIRRGIRFSVDVNALVHRVRSDLPDATPVLLLLPELESELEGFTHEGQARPYGLPEWRVTPVPGVTAVEPMAIEGLRPLLARCAHYVVTHQESYGGLVLDALSMGATVHYPRDPLMRGHALVAMRTNQGFRESKLPQIRSFSSLDELLSNLRTAMPDPAQMLEPAVLVRQMIEDALSRLE
jgi:hypothetical protein